MLVLIEEILVYLGMIGAVILAISPTARKFCINLIVNFVSGAVGAAVPLVQEFSGDLVAIVQAFMQGYSTHGPALNAALKTPIEEFAKNAFVTVLQSLEARGTVSPEQWADTASEAMADAVGFGLGSFAIGAAFESLFPERLNTLNSLGPMLATMAGFEEVTKNALGPHLRAAIGIPAQLDGNAKFRPNRPTLATLTNQVARGILPASALQTYFQYSGLPDEWLTSYSAAAYHGYSPRVLLRVIESNLFSTAEIQDELTFSGMRPVSQARMLKAAPYLATQQYRTQLHSAIEQAYLAGLIADADVTSNVDAAESDTDRDNLILLRLHWEQLIASTKALEQAYTTQYVGHVIDLPTFEAQLAGLGLQSWKVNNILATAEARVNAALERQAEAAARLLEKQTISDIRKAALWNFKSGTIDAAGLAAALVATGLTAVQAAAWVDLAELQQGGSVAYLYGQLLNPSQRKILNSEVSAIGEQVIKGVLSPSQAFAQLEALKIPAGDINALVAKWSAEIAAPNAHAQLYNAVTGKPPTS